MLETANKISDWIKNYAIKADKDTLVVGVSGGIDSALVSTLCARTGMKTFLLSMPIKVTPSLELARRHIESLNGTYTDVSSREVYLETPYTTFSKHLTYDQELLPNNIGLAQANLQSRMRMCTLYYYATTHNGLVIGTGNKVEDFGVGFFTKYGDGGVDLSPIGDLTKTQVREMAKALGVDHEIINAEPTDGLWDDGRTDEDQLGCTYEELEWAMNYDFCEIPSLRQHNVLRKYYLRHKAAEHKLNPIPVFKLNN